MCTDSVSDFCFAALFLILLLIYCTHCTYKPTDGAKNALESCMQSVRAASLTAELGSSCLCLSWLIYSVALAWFPRIFRLIAREAIA